VYELWPGAIISSAVIGIAHLLLWDLEIPRVPSYIIGTSCVLSGMLVSAWATGQAGALVFYLFHLVPAGAVVVFAWAVRGTLERRKAADEDADRIRRLAERERTG
jgi:hypothetical protein